MIFDKQMISKRAQDILAHPRFIEHSQDKLFSLKFDQNDKVLTVHHCPGKKTNEFQLLFSEVFCVLSKGKLRSDLWALTFREFENFLRDDNHLPAFVEHVSGLEMEFLKLKLVFLAGIYVQELVGFKSYFEDWGSLPLVLKNKITADLCQKLGWNLIYAEESTLYVQAPFSWPASDDLTFFLDQALGGSIQKASIKVVAVSG